MKVCIVTEGYLNTGYGHITRCNALYQAFEENGIKPVLIINGDNSAKAFAGSSHCELLNWLESPEILYSKCSNADIVIVDSYSADENIYGELRSACRCLAAVDDYMRLDYNAHVIINGTIGSEEFPYNRKEDTAYLLGARYIPLRKEFWNVDQRNINAEIKDILITMGGQDIRNLTQPILDYLLDKAPYVNYHVVAKENFKIDFKKHTSRENVKFVFDADALKMKELMMQCDIAVTAAGQTLYELARTGLPSVAVIAADNQIENLRGWIKNGFIQNEIIWNDESLAEKLGVAISGLSAKETREKMSETGMKTIDGSGALLIARFLLELLEKDQM